MVLRNGTSPDLFLSLHTPTSSSATFLHKLSSVEFMSIYRLPSINRHQIFTRLIEALFLISKGHSDRTPFFSQSFHSISSSFSSSVDNLNHRPSLTRQPPFYSTIVTLFDHHPNGQGESVNCGSTLRVEFPLADSQSLLHCRPSRRTTGRRSTTTALN